jgi:hypothetical protein
MIHHNEREWPSVHPSAPRYPYAVGSEALPLAEQAAPITADFFHYITSAPDPRITHKLIFSGAHNFPRNELGPHILLAERPRAKNTRTGRCGVDLPEPLMPPSRHKAIIVHFGQVFALRVLEEPVRWIPQFPVLRAAVTPMHMLVPKEGTDNVERCLVGSIVPEPDPARTVARFEQPSQRRPGIGGPVERNHQNIDSTRSHTASL